MNQELLRHNPDYVRLPGGGRTLTGTASYWLARDHLLVVEVPFVTESYRRFELRDIQSLGIRQTNRRGGMMLANLIPLLVSGLLISASITMSDKVTQTIGGLVRPDSVPAFGVAMAILLCSAILSAANYLLGPTCYAELQTSVQTIPLPGLRRWRKAEQFLAALTPAIQAAQAHLPKPAEITPQPEVTPSPSAPSFPAEN